MNHNSQRLRRKTIAPAGKAFCVPSLPQWQRHRNNMPDDPTSAGQQTTNQQREGANDPSVSRSRNLLGAPSSLILGLAFLLCTLNNFSLVQSVPFPNDQFRSDAGRRLLEDSGWIVGVTVRLQGPSILSDRLKTDQKDVIRDVFAEQVTVTKDKVAVVAVSQVPASRRLLESGSLDVSLEIMAAGEEAAKTMVQALTTTVENGDVSAALVAAGLDAQCSIKTPPAVKETGNSGGVPTKLLIGVLVPVGVLVLCLIVALFKYSSIFKASRDSKDRTPSQTGVSAEMGFHQNGKQTSASEEDGEDAFVALGGSKKAVAHSMLAAEAAAEKKRASKGDGAHPGIGLGSVFGE
eukprot:CAMPEP_0181341196 /NCGR_PEP_ID=MMETSP1101-20121128/30268_1 /TAXON_ID=46948 /ORGANISM="Rhodomonas abbreviata, Strain Caron Lab Isolate" /LENGTH=348 /DNA_ID=CAMNT_0023452431 /DNA_START=96 /DNA_END=1138 /DNA_ORIENTATION=+